jgi:hypothetical protein
MVDAGVINGGQVPGLGFHQVGSGRVYAHGFGNDAGQVVQALILLLVDLPPAGHEQVEETKLPRTSTAVA